MMSIITAIRFQGNIQMAQFKRQSIQKLIVDQAGSERLILNDLIIGRDGAQALAQLIPQYHPNLLHLQIKGNNIDADGFQMVFMALMHCPGLVSIQAEWNNIGSSASGLMALLYLLRNLRFVELVDLKNNKLNHQHAEIIAQIVRLNNRSLKVLDLRWNDIGEIGAQIIYPALAFNAGLRSILLEDNRISTNTLLQFAQLLKSPSRGTLPPTETRPQQQQLKRSTSVPFPISDGEYPSMEVQAKTAQLRGKIDSEQQEAVLAQEKLQLEIQKAIQKIRVKGSQMHEAQLRFDILQAENTNLINSLHQAERLLAAEKERFFGVDRTLNGEKGALRAEKYQLGLQTQTMMEKTVVRQQKELEDLNAVMAQKHERLQAYLKDRLADKRASREKLAEIKEDIIRFKLSREAVWDRVALGTAAAHRTSWEDECLALQEAIGKAQAAVKAERKKGQYLGEELNGLVMRGLKRQQKCQGEIFGVQERIKEMHKQMTLANVEIEEKQCKLVLFQAATIEKEAAADLNRRYIKYVHSQNSVNLDIERLKQDENAKAERLSAQTLQLRINDLERAVRQQQAQNKMIKNHYQKILLQLEAYAKNTIQAAIFQP